MLHGPRAVCLPLQLWPQCKNGDVSYDVGHGHGQGHVDGADNRASHDMLVVHGLRKEFPLRTCHPYTNSEPSDSSPRLNNLKRELK